MNDSLIGHEIPVNRSASKLFWKAPWWAIVPNEEKEQILAASELKTATAITVDYFKEPPKSNGRFSIADIRGSKIQYIAGERRGRCAIICGWHDVHRSLLSGGGRGNVWYYNGNQYRSSSSDCTKITMCRWWAMLIETGEFYLVDSKKAISKRKWKIIRGFNPQVFGVKKQTPPDTSIDWAEAPQSVKRLIISLPNCDDDPDKHFSTLREISAMGWRVLNHRNLAGIRLLRLCNDYSEC